MWQHVKTNTRKYIHFIYLMDNGGDMRIGDGDYKKMDRYLHGCYVGFV